MDTEIRPSDRLVLRAVRWVVAGLNTGTKRCETWASRSGNGSGPATRSQDRRSRLRSVLAGWDRPLSTPVSARRPVPAWRAQATASAAPTAATGQKSVDAKARSRHPPPSRTDLCMPRIGEGIMFASPASLPCIDSRWCRCARGEVATVVSDHQTGGAPDARPASGQDQGRS